MSLLSGLGTIGGALLGSAVPGVGTALGATIGGGLGTAAGSLFGGGGGGSSGGGGGMDISGILPQSLPFIDDYLEQNFNLESTFRPGDYRRLGKAMDKGKIDKYQLMNLYDAQGLDAGDKNYFKALTSTIDKKKGKKLAGVVGKAMFRGEDPSRKSIKDAYKYAALTGATGTPKEAQQAMASYFAQTPMGMRTRMPSSQELLAGMKYGPLVGTDSGVFLFGGTDRTNAMFDRLDAGRAFRAQKTKDIFNT